MVFISPQICLLRYEGSFAGPQRRFPPHGKEIFYSERRAASFFLCLSGNYGTMMETANEGCTI
jgi:hypothetical protein